MHAHTRQEITENNTMQMTGNTILITGGGTGIGRGLAEALHALGNKVIISGRRQARLDETVAASPGIEAVLLDIDSASAIADFGRTVVARYPELNVVIQNAGIMIEEKLKEASTANAEAMITTNVLGPIRLTAALLPHLIKQPKATIMTVTSGLAYTPLALNPTYSATKAAIHSYTQSLRYQLADTAVEVVELVPPYVRTELQGARQANDPTAMPLDEFIAEVIELLKTSPDAKEILVERVKRLRFAEVNGGANGGYDEFFKSFNDAMKAARS